VPRTLTSFGLRTLAAIIAGLALSAAPACAQGKVEARYSATLGGIPIGSGTWVIDIAADHYMAAASGRASGLMRVFASGEGSSAVRGLVKRGRLLPGSFAVNMRSHDSFDVRMEMSGGNVKDLVSEPPLEPSPDRVPLTEAHRKGIVDPMTAVLMPVGGKGDVLTAEACQRKLPIFDGRQRFDLKLAFKRMDQVESERGYSGGAVVCSGSYEPIAGHRPGRYVIRYLQETRELEIWLVPIAGTRIVVPYRVSIPTFFGIAILQATQFETEAQAPAPSRATSTPGGRPARGS